MKEYYRHKGSTTGILRKTPIDASGVAHMATRRNPVNHPTVMFRKADVLNCGNYQPCLYFEDYLLWARMLRFGYKIANIPQVLVETEVDLSYFYRRGWFKYLKSELDLLLRLRRIGFLSFFKAGIFLVSRLPLRVFPVRLRRLVYRFWLREP